MTPAEPPEDQPVPSSVVERLTNEIWERRVPHADRRNPNEPPPAGAAPGPQAPKRPPAALPMQLLWHHRDIQTTIPGQYRLTVPLSGGPPSPHASRDLSRILHHMWVVYPSSELSAATSVAAVIVEHENASAGATYQLILLISLDAKRSDRRIDGVQMARHLRAALSQLAATAS